MSRPCDVPVRMAAAPTTGRPLRSRATPAPTGRSAPRTTRELLSPERPDVTLDVVPPPDVLVEAGLELELLPPVRAAAAPVLPVSGGATRLGGGGEDSLDEDDELEPLEVEPPPELEELEEPPPDDELDEPAGGREAAWAMAHDGVARATPTARQNAALVDLVMMGPLQVLYLQLYCHWGGP